MKPTQPDDSHGGGGGGGSASDKLSDRAHDNDQGEGARVAASGQQLQRQQDDSPADCNPGQGAPLDAESRKHETDYAQSCPSAACAPRGGRRPKPKSLGQAKSVALAELRGSASLESSSVAASASAEPTWPPVAPPRSRKRQSVPVNNLYARYNEPPASGASKVAGGGPMNGRAAGRIDHDTHCQSAAATDGGAELKHHQARRQSQQQPASQSGGVISILFTKLMGKLPKSASVIAPDQPAQSSYRARLSLTG